MSDNLGNFLKTVVSESDNILAVKYIDENGKVVLNEESSSPAIGGRTFSVVTPRKY